MNAPGSGLTIAVAQFSPNADRAANLDRIAEMTADAAAQGARVVVFPEYSSYFIDPFDATLADGAESLDGPFVAALTTMALRHGITVVAGLLERASDGARVRNTVVAVSAAGLLAYYRKMHLYDAFGQRESDWVEPGAVDAPRTFDIDGLRFGLQTCYDLRFPEVTRRLADAGVHVVLVPSEWVRGPLKEHHWQTLLAARAIENTLYMVAADHTPPLGVGHSMIVDPQGVALATIGTASDVAVARVRLDVIERVRQVNPALELRRFTVVAR